MSKRGEEWDLIGTMGEKLIAQISTYQELKLSLVHREIQRMADDKDTTVSWDREKFNQFKTAWDAADKDEKESFTFQGNEYLVSYGRYLLEYLDHIFGEEKTA